MNVGVVAGQIALSVVAVYLTYTVFHMVSHSQYPFDFYFACFALLFSLVGIALLCFTRDVARSDDLKHPHHV